MQKEFGLAEGAVFFAHGTGISIDLDHSILISEAFSANSRFARIAQRHFSKIFKPSPDIVYVSCLAGKFENPDGIAWQTAQNFDSRVFASDEATNISTLDIRLDDEGKLHLVPEYRSPSTKVFKKHQIQKL